MTKIVFMGTPAFSVPILEGLLQADYDIVAVVTQPDRPVGRKRVVTPSPVKEAAVKYGIDVLQPEKIGSSVELERLFELKPDLIVTAAFGQFLPESLLQLPKKGAINVHASLLPKYRGGAPVHYAIWQGEQQTGVTIMEMVKKMDAGGIYKQASLPITKNDDTGKLFQELSLLGRDLLLETLPAIISGKLKPVLQDESKVTYAPNITREQERIDWSRSAEAIDWQVRGMRPWPVAFTEYQGVRWKLWDVTPLNSRTEEVPGTIITADSTLQVAAGDGTVLQINSLQPSGKKCLTAAEFLNGSGQLTQAGTSLT